MKAIVCQSYGPPSLLRIEELPAPTPTGKQVLVRVHATAINDYDWSMVRGKPAILKLMFGLRKPKNPVPGMEAAGVVEATGPDVTRFKVGDEVYGDTSEYGFGAFAEYLCIHEDAMRLKPDTMSFAEAAATPHASLLAYQGLIKLGGLKEGAEVLLNGGGGGVGTFAYQMTKPYGCEVTGVDAGPKLDRLKKIGFDRVIDYRKADFTRTIHTYDVIFDCKTNRWPLAYLRALKPGGVYVTVGGHLGKLLALLVFGQILRLFSRKRLKILGLQPNEGLDAISQMYEDGKLKAHIDGPYPLENAPEMIQRFGDGEHFGKVVLDVPVTDNESPLKPET
jgi:NADPH:quinone reductase-like Zn-dependent oxidoreductase